jgi:hypothetical protein
MIFSWKKIVISTIVLSLGYSNCAKNEDSVITLSSEESNDFCPTQNSDIVAPVIADQESAPVPGLTPVDQDLPNSQLPSLIHEQDYLDTISALPAHNLVLNSVGPNPPKDVVVAVIDTGVDHNHPDLAGQMYRVNSQIVGYDFFLNRTTAMDFNGHGTHVAGLIAANGKVLGGAPFGVKIMPINVAVATNGAYEGRVLGADGLDQAIRFAVDNGADVLNLSLGGTVIGEQRQQWEQIYLRVRDALQYAVDNGAVVVIAAGNDNRQLTDNGWMTFPARYGRDIDGVITVSAYDSLSRVVSPFTNYSSTYAEVLAPGSTNEGRGLLSTFLNSDYRHMPGTSMAAPLVAGLAALIKVYLKNHNQEMTAAQIEDLIKQTSNRFISLSGLAQNGNVINYQNAISRLIRFYENGIIEHPRNLLLRLEQNGRMVVVVSDFNSIQSFQWYRDGEPIEGANRAELWIRNYDPTLSGTYHVEIQLGDGSFISSIGAKVTTREEKCKPDN